VGVLHIPNHPVMTLIRSHGDSLVSSFLLSVEVVVSCRGLSFLSRDTWSAGTRVATRIVVTILVAAETSLPDHRQPNPAASWGPLWTHRPLCVAKRLSRASRRLMRAAPKVHRVMGTPKCTSAALWAGLCYEQGAFLSLQVFLFLKPELFLAHYIAMAGYPYGGLEK